MSENKLHLDPANLPHREIYNLLHGCVVPRPIAWVTSVSPEGLVNAAPFSAFSIVSTHPPMLLFTCGIRDGERKDTARNVASRGEYCINIVSTAQLEGMHATSAQFPPEISEPEALGIALEPCQRISVPRIAASPASFECVLRHIVPFGKQDESFVGEVVSATVRDGMWEGGRIDQQMLNAIGRIGGPTYVTPGEYVSVKPARADASALYLPDA